MQATTKPTITPRVATTSGFTRATKNLTNLFILVT